MARKQRNIWDRSETCLLAAMVALLLLWVGTLWVEHRESMEGTYRQICTTALARYNPGAEYDELSSTWDRLMMVVDSKLETHLETVKNSLATSALDDGGLAETESLVSELKAQEADFRTLAVEVSHSANYPDLAAATSEYLTESANVLATVSHGLENSENFPFNLAEYQGLQKSRHTADELSTQLNLVEVGICSVLRFCFVIMAAWLSVVLVIVAFCWIRVRLRNEGIEAREKKESGERK